MANYLVTGKAMKVDEWTQRYLPSDSITDTAFQLLKGRECLNHYNKEFSKSKRDNIKKICNSWIMALRNLDTRDCSAWPHTQRDDMSIFRLDDHVWIWKAFTAIEDLQLWPEGGTVRKMKYSSEAQREILRRFTTENEILKRRMLAVTGSSRETRFLFHAKDTALFYGYDEDFPLLNTSFRKVWENTMEAQALHGHYNQDTFWDTTLRHALAIMMGTRNYSINQLSPADSTKRSLEALFEVVGVNGFFPGEIDAFTKIAYSYKKKKCRDFNYFHASFEIPFVLLTNAVQINAMYKEYPTASQAEKNPLLPSLHGKYPGYYESQKLPPKHQQAPAEEQIRAAESMKKSIPFSRLFDSTTVVEIDEEWLYNYPSFLSNEPTTSEADIPKVLQGMSKEVADLNANRHVVTKGARLDREADFGDNEERAVLVDVGKNGEKMRLYASDCNKVLQEELIQKRTVESAKKRFIWLPRPNIETEQACYLGSVDTERPSLSLFFCRHWNFDDYFFDDTTPAINIWEIELHLSFYQLLGYGEATSQPDESISIISQDPHPGIEAHIIQVSAGFRVLGDFFDRYWTVHFIEHTFDSLPSYVDISDLPFYSEDVEEKAWTQRKVLELCLFEYMLVKIVRCTREILKEIKRDLGVEQGAISSVILSSEDFFLSRVQWQKFHSILEAMDEKLESVRAEVLKWETRERDRGRERPRWTRNDERKYGGIIKKMVRLNNTQIANLRSVHASVKSPKETLARSQEQIRADLSLRGAEDIRFFTYVTVVFLPLGFTSSILSMNGNPGPDLVGSLVTFAIPNCSGDHCRCPSQRQNTGIHNPESFSPDRNIFPGENERQLSNVEPRRA